MAKVVTYDLRAPERDYGSLYLAIESYQKVVKVTESCILIDSDETCTQIREKLKLHMDSDDRLFVAELTGMASWTSAIDSADKVKKVLSGV